MQDFELVPNDEERELVHGWERCVGSVRLLTEVGPAVLADAARGATEYLAQLDQDLALRAAWPMVDYWVKHGGLAFAIDALLEEAVAPSSLLSQGYVGKWQRLRQIVNGLSEPEFVAAVARVEARRAELPLLLRAALAYAFPAHSNWAESDAQEAISKRESVAFNLAALSLPSPELVLEGLSLNARLLEDGRVLTLLLRFGPPVAELLVAHALEPGDSQHSALVLLGVVRSVGMTRRLLPLLAAPRLRSTLLDTLDRHPRESWLSLQGEKLSRDVTLKGRLRDWQELHPELSAPSVKAGSKAKVAPVKGKSDASRRELPRGVMRVLQEPMADLPAAAQQALRDLAQALVAGKAPTQPLTELAQEPLPGAARRVKALIVAWGAAGEYGLARSGIKALGSAGHDFALGQLTTLRDGASHRKLSDAAQIWVARSKLSEPELDDRKLDDFGLGAPLVVSLGKRKLRFDFGASLNFVVRGDDGKPKTSFPPQRKDDEPISFALAKGIWERLRTEATPELRQQAWRLETAMVDERQWPYAAFRGVLLRQPLLAYLARQLLWRATERGNEKLFRVAEDGTLANVDDEPLELGASAAISLPHPLSVADQLSQWGERFADYEINQPFEQLGREFVPAAEPAAAYLERLDGTLGPKARFVLAGQGWSGEEDFAYGGSKLLRGTTLSLWLIASAGGRFRFELDFEADKLDAIARSEVYRDLAKCGLRKDP